MFLLVLMLDNPRFLDRMTRAWNEAGIHGIYQLESVGCRVPEGRTQASGLTGFLSFGTIFYAGQLCHAMLIAPIDSLALAERAAAEVARVVGPWSERHGARMYVLPVAAHWGAGVDGETCPGCASA